jgi:putative ABC transport system substrate-binding protein
MRGIGWFTGVGILVSIAGIAGSACAAEQAATPVPGWFKLDTSLAKDWEAVEVRGDTGSILLRRRGEAGGDVKRHILSLQSRASSAYDVALSEAASVLEQKLAPLDILVVNYNDNLGRAQTAVTQAEKSGFDLILATGSDATEWLWKNYHGGSLPVVSMCAKDPVTLGQVKSYNAGTGSNFALTSLNLPIDVQLAYALEVMPGLRNLAIIVDSANQSAIETQAVPAANAARAHGIRVLTLMAHGNGTSNSNSKGADQKLTDLVNEAVETMQVNDANLVRSMFLITGSTAVFEQMASINAHAARVPVISMVPETVQSGASSAVLSIGVSFRSNAFLAASYAASILDGRERPGDLKVGVVTPPDIGINFRRAREIGLKVPFSFFESANVIYNNDDIKVRPNDVSSK